MITLRKDTRKIVVHCSATRLGRDTDLDIDGINAMHAERGFNRRIIGAKHPNIGYHEVIPREGGIQCGRYHDEEGAGHKNHNYYTYHICLIGGLDTDGLYSGFYTDVQLDALEISLDHKLAIWPNAEVVGHRDLPDSNKACPCFDAGAWYKQRKLERLQETCIQFPPVSNDINGWSKP